MYIWEFDLQKSDIFVMKSVYLIFINDEILIDVEKWY